MIVWGLLASALVPQADALPADVRSYIARRDACDHFRGEGAPEGNRQDEIEAQMRKLCTGTDAELARLKRAHAHKPAVQRALARFDPRIED